MKITKNDKCYGNHYDKQLFNVVFVGRLALMTVRLANELTAFCSLLSIIRWRHCGSTSTSMSTLDCAGKGFTMPYSDRSTLLGCGSEVLGTDAAAKGNWSKATVLTATHVDTASSASRTCSADHIAARTTNANAGHYTQSSDHVAGRRTANAWPIKKTGQRLITARDMPP